MTLYSQKRSFYIDSFVEAVRDHLNQLKSFVKGSGRNLTESELTRFRRHFFAVESLSAACGLTDVASAAALGRYFEMEIRAAQSYMTDQTGVMMGLVINKMEEMIALLWISRDEKENPNFSGELRSVKHYFKKKYPDTEIEVPRKVSFIKEGDSFGVDLPTSLLEKINDDHFFTMVMVDYSLYEEQYDRMLDLLRSLADEGTLVLHGAIDVSEDHHISRNAGLPYYLVLKTEEPAVDFLREKGISSVLLKAFSMPRSYRKIKPQKLALRRPPEADQEPSALVGSSRQTTAGSEASLSPEALDEFRLVLSSSVKETVSTEMEKLLNKNRDELQQRIHNDIRHEMDMMVESTRKKSRKERRLEQTGGRKVPVSIASKIIAIVSIILVLSIGSVAAISSWRFSESLRESAEEINRSNASEISSIMAQSFENKIMTIQGMLQTRQESMDDLSFFFSSNSDILNFTVVGKEMRYSNRGLVSSLNLTEEILESVIDTHAGRIALSSLGRDRIEVINVSPDLNLNRPVILISYPLGIGTEVVPLVIFLDISDTLMQMVQTELEPEKKAIYIINPQGDVLAHSDLDMTLEAQNFLDRKLVQDLQKSTVLGTSQFTDDEGYRWIGSYNPSGFAGLWVVAQIREDQALKVVYDIIKMIGLITIIVVSLSIFFIQIFSNSIVDPLRRLVGASRKIQDGDYDIKLKSRSKDEVGVLTEAFIDMSEGLAERERLKDSFGKFVNKDLAEMAMKGEIALGGEIKRASIFFSDIRSFTAISEKLEPDEVVEFLNEYMTRMVECVNLTNGNVDKYIGDAIMAVWGTPISTDSDTENSINGSLLMRKALMDFNQGRGGDKKPIIQIGCGINTGDVLAGQIGSSDKMEYTVIGDAVNLASRIEALNKPMGTDILISSDTYEEVKALFDVVPMNKIMVKGKSEPQQIYAVLGRLDDESRPKSLAELRQLLNIKGDFSNTGSADLEKSEEKFEILE